MELVVLYEALGYSPRSFMLSTVEQAFGSCPRKDQATRPQFGQWNQTVHGFTKCFGKLLKGVKMHLSSIQSLGLIRDGVQYS